ncbi:MAG: phosphotransferase [Bacteriovoracaceae bacterium]|nr:phosphotransferase [Bacteriovoracaceae bacterium]
MICLEKESFNEEVKHKIIHSLNLSSSKVKELEGFTCHVFEVELNGKPSVLKISHSSWEKLEDVESEKKLLYSLQKLGVPLSAMESEIVCVSDNNGEEFIGRCYQYIEGSILEDIAYENSTMKRLGEVLGLFHKYGNSLEKYNRPTLKTADYYNFSKYVPREQESMHIEFAKLFEEINNIPKTEETYGLTHGDCHPGNVLKGSDDLFLIDFNDMGYNYFLNDLATVLYMTFPPEGEDASEFILKCSRDLFHGYRKHMNLEPEYLEKMHLFLKLRTLMFHTLESWVYPFYSAEEKEEAKAGIKKRIQRVESNYSDLSFMMNSKFI